MSAPLTVGTVFAGRYRLIRCIAAGGMGAVYEAVHLETDRRRALKVMHGHLFLNDEMRERFKREARIAAQIESEHIVDVSDAGVDEATRMPFLVMELLRGEDLHERLKRLGPRPSTEVVTHLRQAALALDKTHAQGIIHRDLKPQNLFLTQREDGTPRIKILDFGIAKVVRDGATAASATQSIGTPIYMAPEQFRVGTKLAPAADIYALGMMAFTLLAGHAYWSREAQASPDVLALVLVAMTGPKEAATARAAAYGVSLPHEFDAWFTRVTALNPTDRFRSATEAVHALTEALDGLQPVTAPAVVEAPAQASTRDAPPPPMAFPTPTAPLTSLTPGVSQRPATPQVTVQEAPTATSAAVTLVQAKPSRQPAIAVLAAVGIAAAVGLTWAAVRSSGGTQVHAAAGSTSVTAAPETTTASGILVATSEAPRATEPAPSATPAPPASGTTAPPDTPTAPGVAPTLAATAMVKPPPAVRPSSAADKPTAAKASPTPTMAAKSASTQAPTSTAPPSPKSTAPSLIGQE